MLNLANVICVKLRSNSGRKLNDNQLEYISIHNDIPLSFLREMRDNNYFKIYFEKTTEKGNVNTVLIARSSSTNIYFLHKFKKIPEGLKAQIKLMESVKIPKENVSLKKPGQTTKKSIETKTQLSKGKTSDKKERPQRKPDTQKSLDLASWTKNVIKVDFRLDDETLIHLFNKIGLEPDSTLKNREDFNVVFLMIFDGEFKPFAFIRKGEKGIEFSKNYYRALGKMQKTNPDDLTIIDSDEDDINFKPSFEFDIDSILEKISRKGITSLTKEEKDFLDNYSK